MAVIAVIGGGLAGLTVALRRVEAGDRIVLFEAEGRLGGQLWTERTDGFVVEHGAEGFVARSEAVQALAEGLGIGADLVGQLETRSYGFDGERLVALAPGEAGAFLGFQVARDQLGQGIRTFRLGMGQLTDALVERVRRGAEVRSGAHAARVEARGDRWAIVEADAERIVDAVVIATTAATAAPILAPLAGEAAGALGSATTVSSTTVTLAYPRDAIDHPLDGTGFVVAASHQEHGFRACTFVTSKFAGRAPDGLVTLRAFFRPTPEDLASLSREGWIDRAAASLARVLAVRTAPSRAWVTTWASALPVFDRTHADRVRALEAALPRGVLLAGSAFHGSGIDAAVRSAEAAAKALG